MDKGVVPSSQLPQGPSPSGMKLNFHPSGPPEASFQGGECLVGIWAAPETQWGTQEMPLFLSVGNVQREDTWTTSSHSSLPVAQQVASGF